MSLSWVELGWSDSGGPGGRSGPLPLGMLAVC